MRAFKRLCDGLLFPQLGDWTLIFGGIVLLAGLPLLLSLWFWPCWEILLRFWRVAEPENSSTTVTLCRHS
jgi:hypothetical protein